MKGTETRSSMDPEDVLAIFHAAPTPCLILDSAFTIIDANEAGLTVTRSTREETIGKSLFDALTKNPEASDAARREGMKRSLETVLRDKVPHRMDVQRHDVPIPDGDGEKLEERYWRPLSFPVLDREGKVKLVVHQLEDVTAEIQSSHQAARLRAVESATEWNKSRLSSIFEGLPIGISIAMGPELVMAYANPMYRTIVGRQRKLDGLTAKEASPISTRRSWSRHSGRFGTTAWR